MFKEVAEALIEDKHLKPICMVGLHGDCNSLLSLYSPALSKHSYDIGNGDKEDGEASPCLGQPFLIMPHG